jgi:hypothetical protein
VRVSQSLLGLDLGEGVRPHTLGAALERGALLHNRRVRKAGELIHRERAQMDQALDSLSEARLDQVLGACDRAHGVCLPRPAHRGAGVINEPDALGRRVNRRRVRQVSLHDFDRKVAQPPAVRAVRTHEHPHANPLGDQPLDQMDPDEPSASRH